MVNAVLDENNSRTLLAETNDSNRTPTPILVDPVTKRVLVDVTGTGLSPATYTVATLASGFAADVYATGTNDDLTIQDAIDTVTALGGGSIYIKTGTYWINGVVSIPDNIYIFGDGYSTQFKAAIGLSSSINMFQNSDQISGNVNIHISKVSFDGNYSTRSGTHNNTAGHNIMLFGSSNCILSDIYSTNAFSSNFCIAVGSHHNALKSCFAKSANWHNFLIVGKDDGTETYENNLVNCHSIGSGENNSDNAGAGFEFAVYATRNTLTNCVSRTSKEGGIHFFYRSNHNSATNCESYDNTGSGISLVDEADSNIIDACDLYNNAQNGISNTIAFLTRGGQDEIITSNTIYGNGRNGLRGGQVGAYSYSKIIGNIIDNNGLSATSTQAHGTYINAPTGLEFLNNSVTNSGDKGSYFTDVLFSTIDDNDCNNNPNNGIFFDYFTSGITDSSVCGNDANNNGSAGIFMPKGVVRISVNGNKCRGNNGAGLDIRGAIDSLISINRLSGNSTYGLNVQNDSNNSVTTRCQFSINHITGNTLGGIRESGATVSCVYTDNHSINNTTADVSLSTLGNSVWVSTGSGSNPSVSGRLQRIEGKLTDTSSGAARAILHSPQFTPASNSSAPFVGYEIDNIWNPATGITQVSLSAIKGQNRVRGDGLITTLTGVVGDAFVADSSSAATVQATNVIGFDSRVWGRPSGSSTATITTGVGYDTSNLAAASGLTITNLIGYRMVNPPANTITNLIGFDIPSLTRGATLNVGLRIAAPSGGANNYALQLSDTGGTAAGGLTLGTDTQMYRSAANVLTFNSVRLTGLVDPVNPQDAGTKAYIDAVASGLDVKTSVRVATTANITLSGTQTIDGVAVIAGNRVLVKDQTTQSDNGIYVVASGSWTRAIDADTSIEVTSGMFTFISEGTTNASTGWVLATADAITLGSTSLVFTQFSGAGEITAGAGLTKTGNTIDVIGTTNRILVNADSIDISPNYVGQASITTLGTITSGVWTGTAIDHAYLTGIAQADVAGLTTVSSPVFAGLNLTNGGLISYKVGGTLFDHYADVGNTHIDGTTFDDLYTDTTTANTFNANGDKIVARYSGIFVSSATATREIQVSFAGTVILDTGALTTAVAESWDITVMIIRESATVIRCIATIISSTALGAGAFSDTTYTRITSLTLSGTNILKITGVSGGTGAAASDIIAKLGTIAFLPAI